jgi:hypothetical protein
MTKQGLQNPRRSVAENRGLGAEKGNRKLCAGGARVGMRRKIVMMIIRVIRLGLICKTVPL